MPRVTVDVDLDEFDTHDLASELEARGANPGGVSPEHTLSTLSELHYALKFGLNDRVIDLARRYVNDQLGTAL